MTQFDIFGNEIDCEELASREQELKRKKLSELKRFATMQEIHGELISCQCKSCKHFVRQNTHGKTYFKCDLWRNSHSTATDIRANQSACKKYEY